MWNFIFRPIHSMFAKHGKVVVQQNPKLFEKIWTTLEIFWEFQNCKFENGWTLAGQTTQCVFMIPWNLSFRYILFLDKRLQTMLWHLNARVNSHQRWKQTRFRVCFHLWCELTSTMNITEWQVSWISWYVSVALPGNIFHTQSTIVLHTWVKNNCALSFLCCFVCWKVEKLPKSNLNILHCRLLKHLAFNNVSKTYLKGDVLIWKEFENQKKLL